jgi:hypothetical protein
MDKIKNLLWLMILFLLMATSVASARQEQTVLVGHISYVEGELLRYVPENEDWVVTVKDAPFGTDDVLYSNENVKAEFIMPNNTWIRIGGNTQIHIKKLESETTEVDISSGFARFYNKSSTTTIKATTPFGYVMAPPLTSFDLYVGDESTKVSALKGNINFVHVMDNTRYEVIAGSSSILAGYRKITSGKGITDDGWDTWNLQRDSLWKRRLEAKGDSTKYLPEMLHNESYALEENGTWERVYYEGSHRYFWRPLYVSSYWTPFTKGRWTVWYGDNCWIPHEPFGYVTHHYGNWVYLGNCNRWYWAPPVRRVRISTSPFLNIGFGWYPGRVSWIYRDNYIGWIPLAPYERYYCRRYWGPRSFVVNETNINIININVTNCRYKNHAVIVKQKNFYNVNNYSRVRIRGIKRNSFIDSYRGAALINNRVIKNFNKMRQRFNFRNIDARKKPRLSVHKKSRHNKSEGRYFLRDAGTITRKRATKVKPVVPARHTHFKTPRIIHGIAPARAVKKPEKTRFKKKQHIRTSPNVQKSRTRITPSTKAQQPRLKPNTRKARPRLSPKAKRTGVRHIQMRRR